MSDREHTVVVVDDSAEVRALVRTRLMLSGRFDVLGEGGDGREAIDLVRRHTPDLLVLDVSMPVLGGLEALPEIRRISPATRVVMYTGFDEDALAARALELGASALLPKSHPLELLAEELGAVCTGPLPTRARAVPPEEAAEAEADRSVLEEHLERFREVFEQAEIGMATMTLTGHIVRANRALARLTERPRAQLVGRPYASLGPAAAAHLVVQALARARDGGGHVVRLEHQLVLHGEPRWVLATVAPVKDSRGTPLYLFLQAQDITEQRETEEALRESEERFRLLVERVQGYAIFMLEPAGHVMSWNAGAERINGYRADEITGQHFRVFYPPDKQASGHPEHELELAVRDGRYEEDGWRVRKDGSRFWANVLITALYDEQGRHVGFAKVTRDVDEHNQMRTNIEDAAAALASANDELEQANERLTRDAADQAQFLAVTAHELRSPISVLTGSAKLLAEHWADLEAAERSELLRALDGSAARLQRLLDDLLTAARLESNGIRLQVRTVELADLLARCVAAGHAHRPDADITLSCPTGLRVSADPDRLAQAVDNLIGNALRHGAPPVHVGAERRGADVAITVGDAGPGVPAEIRARLFQRFLSGPHGGGTGLGLFITRELARAHGGDAGCEPADGSGTRFVITLPGLGAAEPAG
jgi:PAS domain S-box-containing protein